VIEVNNISQVSGVFRLRIYGGQDGGLMALPVSLWRTYFTRSTTEVREVERWTMGVYDMKMKKIMTSKLVGQTQSEPLDSEALEREFVCPAKALALALAEVEGSSIEQALTRGARIDGQPRAELVRAVFIAACHGHPIVAKQIMGHHSSYDFLAPVASTVVRGGPMSWSWDRAADCAQLIRLAVWAGADPNEYVLEGYRPLGLATLFGAQAACSALLEVGADPEGEDKNGFRAVHLACYGRQAGPLRALLKSCDPTALTRTGRSAWEMLASSNQPSGDVEKMDAMLRSAMARHEEKTLDETTPAANKRVTLRRSI
jgi:hypothetical protein